MWVANSGDGTVSEVAGGETVGDPIYVGNGPSGIAVGKGAVWVALSVDGAVAKIDPDTGRVVKTFSVGTNPTRVAVGFDKVWVTNESVGTVTPIDPVHGVAGSPIAVGHGPNGIAMGAGAVWVTNSLDGTVSRIDPDTLAVTTSRLTATTRRGWRWSATPSGWQHAAPPRSSASTPQQDRSASKLAVGSPPQDVATVGDGAAITTTTSRTEHRGGTFTIVGAGDGMVLNDRPRQR